MEFNIEEIQVSDNKCMFIEECKYYSQDGVICNEDINHNLCPQHNKMIRDHKKSKVEQWEYLMKQHNTPNIVTEK